MYEIQKEILGFKKLKRPSINDCLFVLGAAKDECYMGYPHTKNYKYARININQPCNASLRSIYDNFSKAELLDWAHHLYKKSLQKYHPDLHPEDPRTYTEICQELGRAYLQAVKILGYTMPRYSVCYR